MTQMKIDIPQNLIDEAAGKELLAARRKITNLEQKIEIYKSREAEAKRAIKSFDTLRSFFADNFDLYEEYGESW